ncbi:MAG: PH domain-containing protein [Clostridiales bacterium]|nr:PH domain-containing protein [Clostridiales bacterium]
MKTIDENYFKEAITSNAVEDVLEEGETILWRSKPQKNSYILAHFCRMMPIAIVWLIFDGFFISMMVASGAIREIWWFIIPFFALHLAPVWIWIGGTIKAAAEVKNIEYVFTGKRIIIRTGLIGIDYKYIYYDKIEGVNVKVGIIDRLCKVGDIYLTAAGSAAVLYDQQAPYQLSTKLQKIANDIKTDISFPNAYRPENNPGYNTNYGPKN